MPVSNKRRKVIMARQLAEFYRAKGKIHTYDEYDKEDTKPVRINSIIKMFRGYDIMLKMLPMVDPTIEADLAPKPKAAPKPKPKVKKDDSKDV